MIFISFLLFPICDSRAVEENRGLVFSVISSIISTFRTIYKKREISIWTFQAIESDKGWLVNGVALKGQPPTIGRHERPVNVFFRLIKSYFYYPAKNRLLRIEMGNNVEEVHTDHEGNFELLIDCKSYDELAFYDGLSHAKLAVINDYTVAFKNQSHSYMVISDIDDTIMVSHSAQFWSKLRLLLFMPVRKRKTVEESERAYRALHAANVPFAYVSASEYNLFALISTFIRFHDLPIGPIFLRSYRRAKQLLFPPERKDYKVNRIKRLMDHITDKKVVLFGDDSQHDFQIFTEIALAYPQRVRSVYLRKTGFLKPKKGEVRIWEIPESSIPVHYYGTYEDIEANIQALIDESARSN
jgi:hypothetical protein